MMIIEKSDLFFPLAGEWVPGEKASWGTDSARVAPRGIIFVLGSICM